MAAMNINQEQFEQAIASVLDGTFTEEKKDAWDERLATVFNRGFWDVEGSTDGLLAYQKFNEGNGKTIKDHSGNGNTLEAEKGNPTWVSVALPEKK